MSTGTGTPINFAYSYFISPVQDLTRHFHIPFRQSRLTLLLKDAFELESHKICRTVVFANLAPTIADTAMTLNTLRSALRKHKDKDAGLMDTVAWPCYGAEADLILVGAIVFYLQKFNFRKLFHVFI